MSTTNFVANMTLELEIGGENAEVIIGMYKSSIMDDIDQTAWNLCDCDDQVQSLKFGNPTLVGYEIEPVGNNKVNLKVTFKVDGEDTEFIKEVISEYMDGFEDWIDNARNGYYSRIGSRVGTDLQVNNWDLSIKPI